MLRSKMCMQGYIPADFFSFVWHFKWMQCHLTHFALLDVMPNFANDRSCIGSFSDC